MKLLSYGLATVRPTIRFVAVKTVGQQDILMLHRIRSGYIKSRTTQANRIRGLLAEYGIVIPRRLDQLRKGVVDVTAADDRLTPLARKHIYGLYEDLLNTDDQMSRIEKAIMQVFKTSEPCQRLQSIPGICPLTATALVASIGNISCFKNGRELSAWLGIVPKQHSSGDKRVLLGISKRGDSYLRSLLIHGARSAPMYAPKKEDRNSRGLVSLASRQDITKPALLRPTRRHALSGRC